MAKSNSIGALFNEQHPGIKLLIIVVISVIGYYLIKSKFKKIETQKDIVENKAEIKVYEQQGEQPTYDNFEYNDMADDLYAALDGWGTDYTVVGEVINKLQNNVDFLKLVAAFGVRDGYGFQEWIDGDISTSNKQAYNDTLAAKGITKKL